MLKSIYYEEIVDDKNYSYAKEGKIIYLDKNNEVRIYDLVTKTTTQLSSLVLHEFTDLLTFEIKISEQEIEVNWDKYKCGKVILTELTPDYALYGIKHVYPDIYEMLTKSVNYNLGIDLNKVQDHICLFSDEETDSDIEEYDNYHIK